MRRWLLPLAVLAGLLALAACAAEKEVAPATPGPEVAPAWQEQWERVLAAAKREGRVSVIGPTAADARRVLTEPFERKYGIAVEFLAMPPPEEAGRVTTEFQAGRHSFDVLQRGCTPAFPVFKPMGILAPLVPALILPEVKEPKNYRGGAYPFIDKDGMVFELSRFHRGTIFVNPSLADPKQFRSYKDLLDPKWKGKILMDDPRFAGPGNATFTFFYLHKELGQDFIRAFLRQEPTIIRGDFRQQLEWLGQGRFPILVGSSDADALVLIRQGLPITIVEPTQLKEGSDLSAAWGCLGLFKNAPHPNAAKVYINWLLTKEAQTEYNRAQGYVSTRTDAATDHAPAWRIPQAGAISTNSEEAQILKGPTGPLLAFLKGLIPD